MKEYNLNIFDAIYVMEEVAKYFKTGEIIIKCIKGNIPIDPNLFGKYVTVKEIFAKEDFNSCYHIYDIGECKNVILNEKDIKKQAILNFYKNHNTNLFLNNGNKIYVTTSGINESIHKMVRNTKQRDYIDIYLQVLLNLGKIIEKAKLINQSRETKNRDKYVYWNYYFIMLNISQKYFQFEFDVASMDNGENHYRVGRLKKLIFPARTLTYNANILSLDEISILYIIYHNVFNKSIIYY